MSSIVRFVLGAALLLAGASTAMAQSANPRVTGQSGQTGASTAIAAPNNAAVAGQSGQAGASTAAAVPGTAPVADQAQKARGPSVPDNNSPNGGFDPNSTAATRAFFVPQY